MASRNIYTVTMVVISWSIKIDCSNDKTLERNEPDYEQLNEFLLSYEIKWTFSTPVIPHHNGAVESIVKSVKSALNKVVKHEILIEKEYRTFLMEIQDLINYRQL